MKTEHGHPAGAARRIAAGLAFIAFGIAPLLAAFDLGPLGVADINGPLWLGAVAGGIFIVGGLAILMGQHHPLIGAALGIVIAAGLAAIGNWIAFGVGERVCTGSIPVLGNHDLSNLGCRIPFGIGAIITNAFVVWSVVVLLQKMLGGPPRLSRTRSLAQMLLLLSLAPILLPLLLGLLLTVLFQVVRTRLTTGQWPENAEFRQRFERRKAADRQR